MKYVHPRYIRWLTGFCLLAGVVSCRVFPGWGEAYALHVYPRLSLTLSAVASALPFSLCEALVTGSVLWLILYPFYARRKKKNAWRIVRAEVEWMCWLYVWFYWAWGMNYFRADFFRRAGVERVAYDEAVFHHFLSDFTDSLNASYLPQAAISPRQVEEQVKQYYTALHARFGLTAPRAFQHPKWSVANSLYSKVGVLGYMGPFFCENHVNRQLLPVQYPFTYAHELAHLLGVSSEAEANFWGYQACVSSPDAALRYSGYFGLLPYVMINARALLPEEEYKAWLHSVRPEIREEFHREQAYWESLHSPLLGAIQDKIYTLYLKGNRIPSGQKNYAEVIGLLMAYEESSLRR